MTHSGIAASDRARQITTTMDPDGLVTLVRHTNATPVKTLLDYTYGTGGVENGQLLEARDMLSNMKQTFTYVQSGPAKGQVLTATDANAVSFGGGTQHTAQVTYGYDAATGERASSRLQTWAAGQQVWNGVRYEDYRTVGLESPGRAYTQLVRQQLAGGTWTDTDDQYWYSLDPDGRLLYADFAARRRGTQAYTDLEEHNAGSFARAALGLHRPLPARRDEGAEGQRPAARSDLHRGKLGQRVLRHLGNGQAEVARGLAGAAILQVRVAPSLRPRAQVAEA